MELAGSLFLDSPSGLGWVSPSFLPPSPPSCSFKGRSQAQRPLPLPSLGHPQEPLQPRLHPSSLAVPMSLTLLFWKHSAILQATNSLSGRLHKSSQALRFLLESLAAGVALDNTCFGTSGLWLGCTVEKWEALVQEAVPAGQGWPVTHLGTALSLQLAVGFLVLAT